MLLLAALIWLTTGCATPETTTEVSGLVGTVIGTPATSPIESSTRNPTQEINQANSSLGATVAVDSSPTSEVTAVSETPVPTLDVTEEQKTEFLNLVGGVLTGTSQFHPDFFDELAGMILVAQSMQPGLLNMLNTSSNSFAEEIRPLLEYIEQLTPEEQAQLAQEIIQSYHLTTGEDGAVLVNLASSFATAEYGAGGITHLTIPTTDPREVALVENYNGLISVNARTLNPQTLEEEVAIVPVLTARVESLDHLIYDQQVVLELPGIILAWTDIRFNPGAFTDASGDRLFGRFFHTAGLSGTDAVMALRPLGISNPDMFHPLLYGGAEPQPMPERTGSELENAMATDLQAALALAVQDGSITQERANELQGRFNDADLIAVAPSPVFRAAVLIAASVPETGGEFILDVLLGDNGTGHPIPYILAMIRPWWISLSRKGRPFPI